MVSHRKGVATLNLLKTPPGTLQWPTYVDAPLHFKGVPTNLYKATLRLTPEEATPIIAVIDAQTDKAFAAAQTNPRYANQQLVRRVTYGRSKDTVWVQFQAQEPPLLFDAKGDRIEKPTPVGDGARVSIGYALVPMAAVRKSLFGTDPRYSFEREDGVEVGVRLHLAAVQLLPPVPVPPAPQREDRRRLRSLPMES